MDDDGQHRNDGQPSPNNGQASRELQRGSHVGQERGADTSTHSVSLGADISTTTCADGSGYEPGVKKGEDDQK